MLGFLTFIPSLISGLFTTVNGITSAIANEKIALINAKTDAERIEAQERINALQSQQAVLIADSARSNLDIWVRSILALGPVCVILKLLLWDKVIGSFVGCSGNTLPGTCMTFTTDKLDDHIWYVIMICVGFYFVHSIADMWRNSK